VISPSLLAAIRVAYGVLMMATLASAVPHARRYFLSERWGGYGERGWRVEILQNPVAMPLVIAIWFLANLGLVAGVDVVPCAAVNLALCHYFFIQMRWRGVLRGMGAPGFMAYWLGGAVFLLALTRGHAPAVHPLALLTLQVDFALIMISAGLYKLAAGYRAGAGMELGLVNPAWGYWSDSWRRWRPTHGLFRVLNESAWITEVAAGLLMLVPATRLIGAALIALSFVFIATEIRLGFLCEMVIVCCMLFLPSMDASVTAGTHPLPSLVQEGLAGFLVTYIVLLPIARAGLFYNQLAHKPLPRWLQRALDLYTNAFGLIIWRVFTADVVDFFVRVREEPQGGAPGRELTDYGGFTGAHRFRQVAECIAITSVFTTLKYYASKRELFVDRLVRYARTLPHAAGSHVIFEWVSVGKRSDRFEFTAVAQFRVDVRTSHVEETALSDVVSVRTPHAHSPVHEAAGPGTYVPLRR
jgi:hypothetical protein